MTCKRVCVCFILCNASHTAFNDYLNVNAVFCFPVNYLKQLKIWSTMVEVFQKDYFHFIALIWPVQRLKNTIPVVAPCFSSPNSSILCYFCIFTTFSLILAQRKHDFRDCKHFCDSRLCFQQTNVEFAAVDLISNCFMRWPLMNCDKYLTVIYKLILVRKIV